VSDDPARRHERLDDPALRHERPDDPALREERSEDPASRETRAHDVSLPYDRLVREAGGLAGSHRWLVDRVPPGSTVLDCGCAGGYTARALVEERGCTVDGAEISDDAARTAEDVCRRVYVGSLDDPIFLSTLGSGYDRILFGDVLEHVVEPGLALERIRPHLAEGGRILASIPNTAYWRVRLHLLLGRFEYRDSGLLDRTHLRFFTFRTACRMVERAGFRVLHRDVTCRVPELPVLHPTLCWAVRLLPNVFGYQTLIEAEPWRA